MAEDLREAASFSDRLFGLLKKYNTRCWIFQTRFGIHTFGLKSPIDILVLDDGLKVVKLKMSLVPNKLFFWNPRYSKVLELPEGVIEKTRTEVGDMFKFSTN